MKYSEVQADLFEFAGDYALAHCISADFGMGRGIVVEFNRRFNMKNVLREKYPDYLREWYESGREHGCIYENGVLNLVTKERYYYKPTYDSLRGALEDMKIECLLNGIKKVAMPKIGCGLDKLLWNHVRVIIFDVFGNTDIEIKVCYV